MYDKVTPKQQVAITNMRAYGCNPKLPSSPGHYVSFDPGRTTGWASFREDGFLEDYGQFTGQSGKIRSFIPALDPKPALVIFEEFQVRGAGHTLTGSMKDTLMIIKTIKEVCRRLEILYVISGASNLTVASKWSGLEMEGSHSNSHWVSAALHGWYYLVKNKIAIPTIAWPKELVSE